MQNLSTGPIHSWLAVAVAILGPLMALLIGFVGTDRWLRWQFGESCYPPPVAVKGQPGQE